MEAGFVVFFASVAKDAGDGELWLVGRELFRSVVDDSVLVLCSCRGCLGLVVERDEAEGGKGRTRKRMYLRMSVRTALVTRQERERGSSQGVEYPRDDTQKREQEVQQQVDTCERKKVSSAQD